MLTTGESATRLPRPSQGEGLAMTNQARALESEGRSAEVATGRRGEGQFIGFAEFLEFAEFIEIARLWERHPHPSVNSGQALSPLPLAC